MKRTARNKANAPKLHKEIKHSGSNWAPGGGSNPVSHGPRASGATTASEGRNTDISDFSREQTGGR